MKLRGYPFALAHDAEHIPAGDPGEVLLRVASAHQLDKELRVCGDVLKADGPGWHAVIIRADPDMFDPGNAADVIDVIGHLFEGRPGTRVMRAPCFKARLDFASIRRIGELRAEQIALSALTSCADTVEKVVVAAGMKS